jgi:hypothetical protein
MNLAVSSIVRNEECSVSFHIQYSTPNDQVNFAKIHNALGKQVNTKSADHPTVFNVEEGNHFAARQKDVARRDFGCTPNQICRTAFMFANNMGISHPWDKEEMSENENWFQGFVKRN